MYFAPHKLYKLDSKPTELDENDNPIPDTGGDSWMYLCDCFLHNVTTQMLYGFSGLGINPTHYINMDRRDDLKETDKIKVVDKKDESVKRGEGHILQIKQTSGMPINYTVIYI